MADKPRQKELEDKIFKDEKGVLYHGQRFLMEPSPDVPFASLKTEIWYKNGKIHGKPAIVYPDGLEEHWENGKFIEMYKPPRHLRERLPGT